MVPKLGERIYIDGEAQQLLRNTVESLIAETP